MSTTRRMRSQTIRLALLGLLALSISKPARAEVDAWPALEVTDDSTVVLYPLYVHEGAFLMAFPFYYRTNEARDHHLLWPVVKVADGELERVAPLYFRSGEGELTLLPLIHQTPELTMLTLPPVLVTRNGDDRDWFALPNFYASYRQDELRRLGSLGVFEYERNGDSRDLTSLVIGAAHWGDESRWYGLIGLEGSSAAEAHLWHFERGPDVSAEQLFPVYSRRVVGDSSTLQALLYYREQARDREAMGVLPLFLTTEHRDQVSKERVQSFDVMWPLYSRTEVHDEGGALVSRYRRFGIFSDTMDRDAARTFRVLGIVVRERLGK